MDLKLNPVFMDYKILKILTNLFDTVYCSTRFVYWTLDPMDLRVRPKIVSIDTMYQGSSADFIRRAEARPEHYGKYGLLALAAAYHGNIITNTGHIATLYGWDGVNTLLERTLDNENTRLLEPNQLGRVES